MNTINNKRRKDSVRKIEEAFFHLMQYKELHDISVTEICNAANINKSTFYSNFHDIYDLVDAVKASLEGEMIQLFEYKKTHFDEDPQFDKLLTHILLNQAAYKTYFKLGYHQHLNNQLYDLSFAEKYFKCDHLTYHIVFYHNGISAVIKEWLFSGCKESPEEMSIIINDSLAGIPKKSHSNL